MPATGPPDDLNREAVKALMAALGIDGYTDLARRAGLDRTNVSRILNGERPARPSHKTAIARALKVPVVAITGPGLDPAAADIIETAAT